MLHTAIYKSHQSFRLREPEELLLLELFPLDELLEPLLTEPLLRLEELLELLLTEPLLRLEELLELLLTEPLLRLEELLLLTVPLSREVVEVLLTVVPLERLLVVLLALLTVDGARVLLVTVEFRFTEVVPERVIVRVEGELLTAVLRFASLARFAERVAVTLPEPLVVRTLSGEWPVILR